MVENCRFRLVFHRKTAAGRSCGKLGPGAFQIGKKSTAVWLHPVKNKEKASTSFFIKGRMPTKSPANFQKGTGIFTSCIPRTWFCCGKPGGKSGKHRGKTGFFFTKAVENPVEKVECSVRNGKTVLFLVVKPAFPMPSGCGTPGRGEVLHTAPQRPDFLECPAQSWYNNNIDPLQNILQGRNLL